MTLKDFDREVAQKKGGLIDEEQEQMKVIDNQGTNFRHSELPRYRDFKSKGRGRQKWKFSGYPVPIGTQKFFLAGTRYPSVPNFFLAGNRYPSVPKNFAWYPKIFSVPGTQRYPTLKISSVPASIPVLGFKGF